MENFTDPQLMLEELCAIQRTLNELSFDYEEELNEAFENGHDFNTFFEEVYPDITFPEITINPSNFGHGTNELTKCTVFSIVDSKIFCISIYTVEEEELNIDIADLPFSAIIELAYQLDQTNFK
jgi:glutaredoxin